MEDSSSQAHFEIVTCLHESSKNSSHRPHPRCCDWMVPGLSSFALYRESFLSNWFRRMRSTCLIATRSPIYLEEAFFAPPADWRRECAARFKKRNPNLYHH